MSVFMLFILICFYDDTNELHHCEIKASIKSRSGTSFVFVFPLRWLRLCASCDEGPLKHSQWGQRFIRRTLLLRLLPELK